MSIRNKMIARAAQDMEFLKRFWNQVEKTDSCWLWTGSKNPDGYGDTSYKTLQLTAHRISWVLHYGAIPSGKLVCHHCDNRICIRPNHLFVGTALDNGRDCTKKGRRRKGEKHPMAKLSNENVRFIREQYAAHNLTQTKLGEMFGVSQPLIGYIVRRVEWKHI